MKGLNKITCCLLAALLMPCAGHAENEQYGANFNNADIRQFVEIVGQHLGKTILIDPSVQGTISVRSNDTFSQQEYYQFFLSILDLYGYSVITDAPRDKCTLSCAINGIHAAFHYLKKNYISGCVMTVPTG